MNIPNGDDRDYVGYGATPPVVEWPRGCRLAISLCVNYEEGSEQSIYAGDPADDPLSEWGGYTSPIPQGERNRTIESFAEYGSRVGFWRLVNLFARYEVHATFFACALALERNPSAGTEISARGHEVCSHGYRWENHYGLTRDEERARIALAIESLEQITGVRPIGWYSRDGLTSNSRPLLVEAGFLYDSNSYADDLPYYVAVNDRPHLIVPYNGDLNDIRYWLTPGYSGAQDYFAALKTAVDWLVEEGRSLPRMMSVGLHLRISGRPSRIGAVERFLDYITGNPAIWIARRDEIARWWLDHVRAS